MAIWAVVNLVLAVLGVVLVVLKFLFVLLAKRKRDEHKNKQGNVVVEERKQFKMSSLLWLIAAVVLAVVGIAIFFLTENTSLSMGWVDKWTIVNAIIFIVEILAITLTFKQKKNNDNDENEKEKKQKDSDVVA